MGVYEAIQRALQAECPDVADLVDGRDPRLTPATALGMTFSGILAMDPASGSRLGRSNGRSLSGRAPRYHLVIERDGRWVGVKRFRAWTYAEAFTLAQAKLAKAQVQKVG